MRPILGFLLLIPLAYGALMLVGSVMSLVFASPIAQMLPFAAIGFVFLGALLLSSGRHKAEDVYKRAYVTGGGVSGDVRVWPRLQSEPSMEKERLATPSGMGSKENIEKATPSWLTAANVGSAILVVGIAMIALAYLLSFG